VNGFKTLLHRYRRPVVVAVHLTLTVASNLIAVLLRFDGQFPAQYQSSVFRALPWLIAIRALSFLVFGLYEGLWRYTSVWDMNRIIVAVGISSTAFGLLVRGPLNIIPYPRTIFVIDAVVLVLLLGGVRMMRRTYREFDRLQNEKRILIYGAGDAGELVVRDIKGNRFYNYDPVGFVDDDPAKNGRLIHGIKVLGTRADLPHIMSRYAPHEVLVAVFNVKPSELRAIVSSLEPYRVPIKTLPNIRDVLEGRLELSKIRNLSLEDLMPRDPINFDREPVRRLINGRRVLVTGAGGSIGSELTRQLVELGPSHLVLLERYENSLFELGTRLAAEHPGCRFEPVIADITDAVRVERIFAEARPDVVFHAAAHKHVPLMEQNPAEAVKNNVRGTRIVADVASKLGVGEFVLISSDKAVNPSSVMGATKRVAEQMIRAMNHPGGCRFIAVRFGNVLGSNGSVTRVFEQQIARGGPVTVTHPEIRRFFMLIPEAVELVLHAAAMSDTGTIYALDMGDQIRIQDLARNLIRLSGFVPDEEIEVQFVGLRAGEKLYEELVESGETAETSGISKVLRVRPEPVDDDSLWTLVAQLEQAADRGREDEVMRLLSAIVPTFRPAMRVGGSRDRAAVLSIVETGRSGNR